MTDELRSILGEELFKELSALSEKISDDDLQKVDVLTDEQVDRIANTVFMVQVPIGGTYALELMSALVHAHETDCDNCWTEMNWFTISFIASLMTTILDDIQGIGDE